MLSRFPGLKRTCAAITVFGALAASVSCSSYNNSSSQTTRSGLKFRAFVSNPVHPTNTGGGVPALDIMDANRDILSPFAVSLFGSEPDAGLMAESPKRDRTLVYSPQNNGLAVVNNASESVSLTLTLPGPTESMYVWTDNTSAFIASPTAPITGQPPGGVGVVNISTGAVSATIPVPGAHYLVASPDGSHILVLSDSTNTVSVLDPSLIPSGNPVTTILGPWDKPVGAVFSADGSTAYVLNCGAECGGTAASIVVINVLGSSAPITVPVPGATAAFLQGTTLYVAGTPAGNPGQLTAMDITSLTASPAGVITNGFHNLMQMGSNGQLFIGARHCTNSGCLSIFNTATGTVVIPQASGDVTGIQPITNRNVVYVCEGGVLQVYDTTTDALQTNPVQPNVVGQAVDVKLVDF